MDDESINPGIAIQPKSVIYKNLFVENIYACLIFCYVIIIIMLNQLTTDSGLNVLPQILHGTRFTIAVGKQNKMAQGLMELYCNYTNKNC